jgi:D-hydroxyproline dehydrogenase subunit beta
MDNSAAQFALTRYSEQLWQQLQPDLPASVEYEQRGTIWIAEDEEEMAEVHRKHAFYSDRDVPAEILSPPRLQKLEPNLSRAGLLGGLLVSEDIVLDPPAATSFLLDRALSRGTQLLVGHAVTHAAHGRILTDNGAEIAATWIVNAAGAESGTLTPSLPIRKRKGHLALTDVRPGFLHHQLVELGYLKSAHAIDHDSVAFNVQPRRNGRIVIGSSRQYGSEWPEVDQPILDRMIERARRFLPDLASIPIVRSWTGFRPAPSGALPVIGTSPSDRSLFIATGHEGLGITSSLATGRLVADQITGRKSEIPIEPYWPR